LVKDLAIRTSWPSRCFIDAPPTESVLIWLADKGNTAIRAFTDVATEVVSGR
jgi:hypothetical protein